MRFLEFIIQKSKIIGVILIILGLINLFVVKPKWQYYPLYLIVIGYLTLLMLDYFNLLTLTITNSKCIIGIGITFLILPFILVNIFPSEDIPIPSGKYTIGTKIYDLVDQSRNEVYSDNPTEKRKIKYQVYYPAEKTSGYKKAKWISDGTTLTRQLASNMNLPAFMLDHTAKIDSNSFVNAPVNNELDNYPAVIISHGWKGFRELHTDYAEELASNGIVAVSIDHTYGSQAVTFDDGEIAYLNKDALPRFMLPEAFNVYASVLTTTYGEDIIAVLDELNNLNSKDQDLKNKLDLNRIGLLGHSTGGAGVVLSALRDERVKVVMGLDAWVKPLETKELKQGLKIPSLFLRSEQWSKGPNNGSLSTLLDNSKNPTLIQLDKTNHIDFSMSYMYSPLTKYIGFSGSLGGRKSSEIQREFIKKFFNKNLKDDQSLSDDYLEDIVESHEILDFFKR